MDEVKVRLTKYLDALEAGITKGGEFAQEQAPEVAREIIGWQVYGNGLEALIVVSVCVPYVWFVIAPLLRACRSAYDKEPVLGGPDIGPPMLATFAFIPLIFAAVFFLCCVERSAKGLIAPRLVVIEKIREELR